MGGVSGRAGAKAGGSNPFALTRILRVVAVKGILVVWKAALFAGRRRNEDLDRSAGLERVSFRSRVRADDSGCPEDAEEGNVVGMRHKAYARSTAQSLRWFEDASFARSFDPCTSILTMHSARAWWWGDGPASRMGKPAQAGGTITGVGSDGRSAARRSSPLFARGGSVVSKEKEGDRGLRPCEDQELGFGCSHVVIVAEVVRRRLASNRLGKRAPKRAVRVE